MKKYSPIKDFLLPRLSLPLVSKDLNPIFNYLTGGKRGRFVFGADIENPYQSRSAGVEITKHAILPSGIFVFAEKIGNLSWDFGGVYFRNLFMFFPTPEDPLNLQDDYKDSHESFLEIVEGRIVLLTDLSFNVHHGKGLNDFLSTN